MNCDLGHFLGLIKGLINGQGKEVGEDSRRRNWLYSNVQVSSFFPFPVTAVWDECNVLSCIRGQQRRTLFTLYFTC